MRVCRSLQWASLVLASFSATAFGQTQSFWTNPAGGNYSDGSNWSLGSAGQFPTFNLGSAGYTVTAQAGNGAQQFTVENDNPTFNLNGNTFNNAGLFVATGTGQNGSLTLQGPGEILQAVNGAAVDVSLFNGSSTGTMTINNATIFQQGINESMYFQNLTVENGAQVEQDDQGGAIGATNLTENNGEFSTESVGGMSLYGAVTLTNGSAASSFGPVNVYGNVLLNDSAIASGDEGITFNGDTTLTLANNAQVNSEASVTLPSSTDIISGIIRVPDSIYFGQLLTIVLNPEIDNPFPVIGGGGPGFASGVLDFTLQGGFTPTLGEQFQIFRLGSGFSGTFDAVNEPSLPAGETWDNNDLYTTGTISVVPEPTSIGLILAAGVLLLRRRSPKA